ncbi:MAG TPA: alpha/beta hydrolase, partial [Trueperaceae bacterium]
MRRDVSFPSSGGLCRGWLYLPDDLQPASRAPAIVMANAVTAIKEITLPEYAARFAAAGFVTLAFDYRCWGESDGEPRQHFVAYEQQQDIRNA